MQTVIADTFSRSLERLQNDEQALVKQAVFDFHMRPAQPGGSFHRIESARDPGFWSFRVNRDLRLIVHQSPTASTICYVDHHDDAYRWAESRRFEVNPRTRAVQVVEVTERVEEVVRRVTREEEAPVFARFDPEYLLALGVPEAWLPAVRHVGESSVDEVLARLPQEAAERLLELACGQPVPVPVGVTTTDPLLHPDARRRFVVVESEEQLRRALEAPWERWVVFLHPLQASVVEAAARGPMLVTGGAGTGKTVVALHRAARLLRAHPGARVLLTTFSKTLAARLNEKMDLLVPADDPARARLEIVHLHKLAVDRWAEAVDADFVPVHNPGLTRLIEDAARATPSGLDVAFLRAEWDALVDPWVLRTWDAYRAQPRAGRGTPLGARQRQAAWAVFEQVWAGLASLGQSTWSQVCHELAAYLVVSRAVPFDHVVADECQDFGPAELRLLRALAPAGADDLFLCADAGQRIYRRPFTWSAAGIDVRGRSERLRVNYRTTEQIRRFADGFMPPSVDEADGVAGPRATVSLLAGPEPEIVAAATVDDEIAAVADWIRRLISQGFRPEEIALFCRTEQLVRDRAQAAIRQSGQAARPLSDDSGAEAAGVGVGTMHRAKGLEFRAVVVMACEAGTVPLAFVRSQQADEADRELFLEQERNLLYVACTRARERLLITFKGRRSSLLDAPGVVSG